MKSELRALSLAVVLGSSLIAAFTWGSAGGLSGGKTYPASLTLTNPNGGEAWRRGAAHAIRWTARGDTGPAVRILLCGEGVPDRAIATCLTSKGEYDWTIPEELREGRYKVKIVSAANDAINDGSDSTFEVYAKEPGKLSVKSAVTAKAMNVVNASLAVTPVTDIPTLLQSLLSANHRLQNVTASFVQGPLVQTDSTPNPTSTGIYTNTTKLFGISPGMIVSSGNVAAYGEGPNTSDFTSTDFLAPGSDILTSLSNGYPTYDATVFRVEFDTDSTTNKISFQFVFGSEEYPEWVGSPFNDSFGLYVDGDNIAHDQLGNLITINSAFMQPGTDTELDGNSVLLTASASVTPSTHHVLDIAIADASDGIYDSTVYLSQLAGSTGVGGGGGGVTGSTKVVNTNDSGAGSLRAAIEYANLYPETEILFNIPVTDPGYSNGVFTITPLTPLPEITAIDTEIDGDTETTFAGDTNPEGPEIVVNGSLAGANATGLQISAANCVVQDLVINGFDGSGIALSGSSATGNHVIGCYIGTDATGNTAVPNGTGISLASGAHDNTIGGAFAESGNLVADNTLDGVDVSDGINNRITHNRIFANGGPGIDLAGPGGLDGVTANDAGDPDTGSNNLMNFPVITGISPDLLTVSGTLDSDAPGPITVEVFQSSNQDSTGYGEGQTYIGAATVTSGSWSLTLGSPIPSGKFITATATDADGNTSEFSLAMLGTPLSVEFASGVSAVDESGSGSIVLQLSAPSATPVTVPFTVSGTATDLLDYTLSPTGVVTFDAGVTTTTVSLNVIDDTLDEPNETVILTLDTPTNAILGATTVHTAAILDNDPAPALSINNVTKNEGDSGATAFGFTVTLSAVSGKSVSVSYTTANATATIADGDYNAASGALTFSPGTTSLPVTITVNGDTKSEANETFSVMLGGATNATIADALGVGTLLDDDPPPSLSINDVTKNEGNSGATTFGFTATLSAVSGKSVSVSCTTANATATTADGDYNAASGTLTFSPGTTSLPVTVTVNGDTKSEANETFNVVLSSATNATIADAQGVGTIVDDDASPTISINDVAVTEGNSGTANATFTVSLSSVSGQTVTVDYGTGDGTATSGSDYTAKSGTLTFNPGITTQSVSVAVSGDTTFEPDETFAVNLSSPSNATIADGTGQGTILNDDTPPLQGDLLIKNNAEPDSAYAIDNEYQATPSGEQISAQTVPASAKATYNVRIQNDGTSTRTFLLKATESSGTGWTVAYKNGTTLITTTIKGTGFTTPNLAPGSSLAITVEMTPAGTVAENAQKSATINAFNDKTDTTVRDSVRATTTKLTITQPDALIKKSTEADSALAINDVYQTTPSGDQIEAQTVAKGGKATYAVRIQNDGNTTRTFVVKATESTTTGWTVTYKVGTLNVTTAIKGTGRTTASLKPGLFENIVVDMTAGSTLANGSSKSTTLKVFLTSSDKTVRDTVQATTTVGTSSSIHRDENQTTAPEVQWVEAPPATMASGMNYPVSWQVTGGDKVSHTYVVMSTDPEPTRKPMAMTEFQSGKPGIFKAWVPAPSKGNLYYQVVAIVDGKMIASEVVYGAVK